MAEICFECLNEMLGGNLDKKKYKISKDSEEKIKIRDG